MKLLLHYATTVEMEGSLVYIVVSFAVQYRYQKEALGYLYTQQQLGQLFVSPK
jgi:hypothetical protein